MKRRIPDRDQNLSSLVNPSNDVHHVPYVRRHIPLSGSVGKKSLSTRYFPLRRRRACVVIML
jgi:hypothetical protein